MIYNLKKISGTNLEYLLELVKNCKEASKEQLDIINQNSVGLIDYSYKGKGPVKIDFLSIEDNLEMVDFFKEELDINKNEIISIHLNQYQETSKTLPHKDSNSSRTYLILLDMAEEGGELTLDFEIVPFNEVGQVIDYDGGQVMHGVNEIKKGFRKTLVVWTKPKSIL